jgi:hypothetical protein
MIAIPQIIQFANVAGESSHTAQQDWQPTQAAGNR